MRNQRGIAKWVKWLLAIVVVSSTLLLATCTVVGFTLYNQFGRCTDPAKVKEITATLVTMQELPPRYKYAMGLDVMGEATFVGFEDTEADIDIWITKINTHAADVTAQELLEKNSNGPYSSLGGQMSKIAATGNGSLTVAGREMPYIVGSSIWKSTGESVPVFLGCTVRKQEKEAMLIYAHPHDSRTGQESDTPPKPLAKEIDLDAMKHFLSYISAFK